MTPANDSLSVHLKTGEDFPAIGFGTFNLSEGAETANAVIAALDTGYRLIDTAANYGNEAAVGKGIKESRVHRSEIILTSKVWPEDLGYDKTLRAFDHTMSRLGLEYLDLYLIHWPCSAQLNAASWKALERLQTEKRVRFIGVSNFTVAHLESLAQKASIPPLINQVEFHPLYFDAALWKFCHAEGILLEAWSPLLQGKAFSSEILRTIGRKHNKSAAQTALRWCLQMGVVPIPKTGNPDRMRENFSIFDFHLDEEDMETIGRMNTGKHLVGPDPNSYRFCPEKIPVP